MADSEFRTERIVDPKEEEKKFFRRLREVEGKHLVHRSVFERAKYLRMRNRVLVLMADGSTTTVHENGQPYVVIIVRDSERSKTFYGSYEEPVAEEPSKNVRVERVGLWLPSTVKGAAEYSVPKHESVYVFAEKGSLIEGIEMPWEGSE